MFCLKISIALNAALSLLIFLLMCGEFITATFQISPKTVLKVFVNVLHFLHLQMFAGSCSPKQMCRVYVQLHLNHQIAAIS